MPGPSDRTERFLAKLDDDPELLAARMAATQIELSATGLSPATEVALALTATLLLRLETSAPTLFINAPNGRTRSLPRLDDVALFDALGSEHAGFASVERFASGPAPDPVVRLVFDGDADGVRVDTSGWACAIGSALPEGEGNPIAASFAAVLASAEALKASLNAAGVHGRRIRPWRDAVSLWDYSLSAVPGGPLAAEFNLDDVVFAGCGGVASATAWTLALNRLRGDPLAVDDDTIEDTNLNRQLDASFPDIGAEKAALFMALLNGAGASGRAIPKLWGDVPTPDRGGMELGVISVDDDAARRAFQLDMPRIVLNGGTGDAGYYQVTRHDFVHEACLGCIARADLRSTGPEDSVARRLGLSLAELRPYLDSDEALPGSLLGRLKLGSEDVERLRSLPGRELVRVVCGEFKPVPDQPAVSAPMLSAAPGVLLAAEIAKWAMAADVPFAPKENMVGTNILTGPHALWPMHRAKTLGCQCGDETYRSFYKSKWA